jgi:hypothetical protein
MNDLKRRVIDLEQSNRQARLEAIRRVYTRLDSCLADEERAALIPPDDDLEGMPVGVLDAVLCGDPWPAEYPEPEPLVLTLEGEAVVLKMWDCATEDERAVLLRYFPDEWEPIAARKKLLEDNGQ